MKFRLIIENDIYHFHKKIIRVYTKKSLEEYMNYTKEKEIQW